MSQDEFAEIAVEDLDERQAGVELERLAALIHRANTAYHVEDAPEISDAAYDAAKRRNAAIESRFPALKRADSPSELVGAPASKVGSRVSVRVQARGTPFWACACGGRSARDAPLAAARTARARAATAEPRIRGRGFMRILPG